MRKYDESRVVGPGRLLQPPRVSPQKEISGPGSGLAGAFAFGKRKSGKLAESHSIGIRLRTRPLGGV